MAGTPLIMLNIPGHSELRRIVVLNPKGGSGKSTLAMNLPATSPRAGGAWR